MTDYTKLTDSELQRILNENPVDIPHRLRAKEEIERRTNERRTWTRAEKWTAVGVVIGAVTLIVCAAVVPEVRRWVGLEHGSAETRMPPAPTSSPTTPTGTSALTGLWADTDGDFYEFLPDGRVNYRTQRLGEIDSRSKDMVWYAAGQTLKFQYNGSLYDRKCRGVLTDTVIEGTCDFGSYKGLRWKLELVQSAPSKPVKVSPKPKTPPEPTDGIWADNSMRIAEEPVFFELLPRGRVRMRTSPSGYAVVMPRFSWYRTGETVRVTEIFSNATYECEGKLNGDVIEGISRNPSTGQQFVWKLERIANK